MPLTLADIRQSRLPQAVGLCAGDLPAIAAIVNEAQQRLIMAGGETGWSGGWKSVVFNVDFANPYITLPRQFVRIVNLDVCKKPIVLHNQWYEFLPGTPGMMPQDTWPDWWSPHVEGYERGTVPTMTDMTSTNQLLRAYYTDTRDIDKRLVITGLDANGNSVFTQDTQGTRDTMQGLILKLAPPYAQATFPLSSITGIQKDMTYGDVVLSQVDQTTGVEVILSRFAPTEFNPQYRRYYLTKLPQGCCTVTGSSIIPVTALAKLQYVPAYLDSDWLIIGNLPALIEEAQAIRYSSMDIPTAAALERKHHLAAIRQLQNELRHETGEEPVSFRVNSLNQRSLARENVGGLY